MPLNTRSSENTPAPKEEKSEPGWVSANILNPFANSAAVEPYNAVAHAASAAAGRNVLPRVELLSTAAEPSAVQTVASSLGSLIPFLVAAKVAGVPLRGAASVVDRAGVNVERTLTAKILASESTASIAGGALWGGAKDPHKGETRWGNAFGNAVGFAGFELGGHLSRNLATPLALSVRGVTGFLGGAGQQVVADKISAKELTGQEIFYAGLGGAAMNVALPGAKALFRGFKGGARAEVGSTAEAGNSIEAGRSTEPVKSAEPNKSSEQVKTAEPVEAQSSRPAGPESLSGEKLAARAQDVLTQATELNQFGTGLARAFEKLPEAERPAVFRHLFEEARKVDSNGQAMHDLAGTVRTLSGEDAARAWKDVAALHKDRYANSLVSAIGSLPPSERFGAVSHAIENFPGAYYLPEQLKLVPAQDFPALTRKVMTMADESFMAKGRMLTDWPEDLMQIDAATRAKVVRETFETGLSLSKRGDEARFQSLWANLPDKALKGDLAASLKPEELGKVLFSWADPELVSNFSRSHPQTVRHLAAKDLALTDSNEIRHIESILKDVKNGETPSQVVLKAADGKRHFWFYNSENAVPQLLGEMLSHAPVAEKEAVLKSFAAQVTAGGDAANPYTSGLQLSRLVVERLSRNAGDQALIQDFYVKPINESLGESGLSYGDKLNRASQAATVERMMPIEGVHFRIPDMRMARVETGLDHAEIKKLRTSVENALRDPEQLRSFFGDGPLGKIFPSIFGRHTVAGEGGFVGRPQHGGHEFVLDDHTLLVLKRVNEHPDMAKLSPKEQDDVRWAALMHDAGKRPSMSDPGHEWASANLSWGVLRTLDYPSGRVQRVANLVGRHRDVSFDPRVKASERMGSETDHLDDLSTFYRHPTAARQLRILNESDIRSINTGSTYWHDEVASELDKIGQSLETRGRELNRHAVPILTSELPRRFALVTMDKPHALLVHVSDHMEGKFLDQLAVIESPEYSVSSTLVTENFKRLYNDKQGVVALVSGPVENISQAFRSNLDTGRSVTWKQHVDLTRKWSDPSNHRASGFASELDMRARSVGIAGDGHLDALGDLHGTLSRFDSLDDLVAHHGAGSPYVRGQQEIYRALTTHGTGEPLTHHNEVKLNNPTLVGIGLLRNGRTVHFEDATPEVMARMLEGNPAPSWLTADGILGGDDRVLTVPRTVWQTALDRGLPVVVLDP